MKCWKSWRVSNLSGKYCWKNQRKAEVWPQLIGKQTGKQTGKQKLVKVALLLFCVNLISGRLMHGADIGHVVIQKPNSLSPNLITTPPSTPLTPNKKHHTHNEYNSGYQKTLRYASPKHIVLSSTGSAEHKKQCGQVELRRYKGYFYHKPLFPSCLLTLPSTLLTLQLKEPGQCWSQCWDK